MNPRQTAIDGEKWHKTKAKFDQRSDAWHCFIRNERSEVVAEVFGESIDECTARATRICRSPQPEKETQT